MTGGPLPTAGELVRIRDERWVVRRCHAHGACALLDVQRIDGGGPPRASFLLPFDQPMRLPPVDRPRRVTRPHWRRVVRRALADALPEWWSLRSARDANITLLPFQLEPVLAWSRAEASRLLIADAVGLGKTVQAGLIAAEIIDRTSTPHVLIVCPASLRSQWQEELEQRFALHPLIVDGRELAAHADVPTGMNPWAAAPLLVTSIDFVKRPDVMRSLEPIVWDLVVFDEAHALTGRSDRALAAPRSRGAHARWSC